MEEFQAGVHHAQPFVMPRKVFTLLAHDLTQPALHLGIVDCIVVDPALVAGVVRRVDVDAVHHALELGQQALQSLQVVAVNDPVVGAVGRRSFWRAEAGHLVEHPERHVEMVVDHLVFSHPLQRRHVVVFL